MRKIVSFLLAVVLLASAAAVSVFADDVKYTVVKGDSMWKIARKFEVGLDELIAANPQIEDPTLIYPDQVVTVPTGDVGVLAIEEEIVRLVNEEREKYSLAPLSLDWELSRVARFKSKDMRDRGYFSHQSPTYGSPFEMIRAFGLSYRSAGENIARGYKSAEQVVKAWMASSGHRANILNKSFTKIGAGFAANGNYFTLMLIG